MKMIGMIVGLLCLVAQAASAQQAASSFEDLGVAMYCFEGDMVKASREGVVVRGEAEFAAMAGSARTDLRGCDNAALPQIDFSKRSLMAIYASAGGCEIEFEKNIVRDDAAKTVSFVVTVLTSGRCEKMGETLNWVSVPAIPADYEVKGSVKPAP